MKAISALDPDLTQPRPFLIGTDWVVGSGEPLHSVNPASGELNCLIGTPSQAEVDLAVAAAQRAFSDPGWKEMLPHVRATLLHKISFLLSEREDTLARTVVAENGKTLSECRNQVRAASAIFRYYAGLCETTQSEVTPPRGPYFSFTLREPIGVVAAITTWNSPVNVAAEKLAPALAAGNAVILKPSELTSGVSLELGRLCGDAGVPAGLVNVLPGTAAVSSWIVKHRDIGMVSFTGGTEAGRAIAHAAAEKLMPVLLELGGKSPHIVFADADIERAATAVAYGIFGSMGQSCIAGSRLFVHRSVRDAVLEKVLKIAKDLRVGPPLESTTQLGPLASFKHRDRVHGLVSQARNEGGQILVGGEIPGGTNFSRGAYYFPTVIDGLRNDSETCQTEIFGPVLCALTFDDDGDLIEQANDTIYGLAAGIWTRDFEKAWRVARALDAGTVWLNTYRQNSVSTPFGGFKESGLGRERGPQGMGQYQRIKSYFVNLNPAIPSFDR